MIPSEQRIDRLMQDTGLARMQAIRRLQARELIERRERERQRDRTRQLKGWL